MRIRVVILCIGLMLFSGCQDPVEPVTPSTLPAVVRAEYSGERAFETVAFLDQYVRWPGNRGFDASLDHIAERLEAAGYVRDDSSTSSAVLTYRVESYPLEGPAWEPIAARVSIEGETAPVFEFATNRNMLAVNSHATPTGGLTADLVDVGTGSEAELDAAHIKGRIVMGDVDVGRLFRRAVLERGALGVLGYDMPAYARPDTNRTAIQFGRVPRDTTAQSWGFSLSFDAREKLRTALKAGPVRLKVQIDVTWTPDAVERTVVAEVRGATRLDERFVFSAHVQEPGANDNASGVGAQVEMARVAATLVSNGAVKPGRTITFLWGDEIRSTARFVQQDSVRAKGILWGLSLDMVGEDTEKTGGSFLIEKMPDPSAIWTRGDDRHSEWGSSELSLEDMTPHYFNDFVINRAMEQASTNGWVVGTNPFEGGSDHVPFLRAGIPGLLFWHFTDQYYHTDLDRLEMVSVDELKNVGVTALVSALVLASADGAASQRILDEVFFAGLARLEGETELALAEIADGASVEAQREIIEAWASWYDGAIASTQDLEIGGLSPETRTAIDAARAEMARNAQEAVSRIGA